MLHEKEVWSYHGMWQPRGEVKRTRLYQIPRHRTLKTDNIQSAPRPTLNAMIAVQKVEVERARLCQALRRPTLHPATHFKRKPERGLTRAQQRVVAERIGRAGTAVPDTTASYTQPRGGRGRTRLCQTPRRHATRPRGSLKRDLQRA